jgi:hypothetical protein
MATLELVRLRSTLPTGRLTLRHSVPAFNQLLVELPFDDQLDNRHDNQVTAERVLEGDETATPQVAGTDGAGETVARKGGEAR